MKHLIIAAFCLLLWSCGGNETPETSQAAPTPTETAAPTSSASSFNNDQEVLSQFFPDVEGFTYRGEGTCKFMGSTDDTEIPFCSRTYYDADGGKIKVTIKDYSINNEGVENYIPANNNPDDQEGIWEALTGSNHRGYVKYYNNGGSTNLDVLVDGRFMLKMLGLEQQGIENLKAIFNAIPIDDLASY